MRFSLLLVVLLVSFFVSFEGGLVVGQATRNSYDFIIVGAGSAGSVLAGELAQDCRSCSILLIEAGGDNTDPAISNTYSQWDLNGPDYAFLRDDQDTVPAPNYFGRSIKVTRGKMLGGSFGCNAMFHVPGHPGEWDQTAADIGDNSWTWRNTQQYRRKIPREFDIITYDARFAGTQQYVNAITSLGYAYDPDDSNGVNGISPARQIGRFNPDRPGGIRQTSYDVKVLEQKYPNVQIITFHRVAKVLIDSKKVAYGVQVINLRSNRSYSYNATREVILSAGTFRTPQILQLSGLGPATHLQSLGIPVIKDLPVGNHLNDHLGIQTYWENLVNGSSTPFLFATPNLLWFGPEKTGPPSFEFEMAGGFISVLPNTIQLEGTVRLASADPLANPVVDYNLSNAHEDVILDGVKNYLFPIVTALRNAGVVGAGFTPVQPGATDAAIRAYIRGTLGTNYHPVGTARVGAANDATSVVDSHFRVRGITRLRVVDASVLRIIPSGNINSPVLALAYFAADVIACDNRI